MIKKIINMILNIPTNLYNKLVLRYRKVLITNKPLIKGRIYLVSDKKAVSFGKNVRINSSLQSNPIGGSTRTIIFACHGANIKIGNNVGISNSTIFAAESIVIEDDVMIGGNCKIYDTDFHSVEYNKRLMKKDQHVRVFPVVIKKGVFIGAHSIILKGVTIGQKSVIAAGSVVTKNIPANELWGGSPAKFIRSIDNENIVVD